MLRDPAFQQAIWWCVCVHVSITQIEKHIKFNLLFVFEVEKSVDPMLNYKYHFNVSKTVIKHMYYYKIKIVQC